VDPATCAALRNSEARVLFAVAVVRSVTRGGSSCGRGRRGWGSPGPSHRRSGRGRGHRRSGRAERRDAEL